MAACTGPAADAPSPDGGGPSPTNTPPDDETGEPASRSTGTPSPPVEPTAPTSPVSTTPTAPGPTATTPIPTGTTASPQEPPVTSTADQTIDVRVVGGRPEGGVQRVDVPLGSSVALFVTSDVADEVHVHGYDVFALVAPAETVTLEFTADIPGVFNIELEDSGVDIAELAVR